MIAGLAIPFLTVFIPAMLTYIFLERRLALRMLRHREEFVKDWLR